MRIALVAVIVALAGCSPNMPPHHVIFPPGSGGSPLFVYPSAPPPLLLR